MWANKLCYFAYIFLNGIGLDAATPEGGASGEMRCINGELPYSLFLTHRFHEQVVGKFHIETKLVVVDNSGTNCPKVFGGIWGAFQGLEHRIDVRADTVSCEGWKKSNNCSFSFCCRICEVKECKVESAGGRERSSARVLRLPGIQSALSAIML